MNNHETIRNVLVKLRENARLTQAQLADRLSFTPSRLSRLESGDTELNQEEAAQIAKQIGTEESNAYANYLATSWLITEQPGFKHPSRDYLWKAEAALQRLQQLETNPELKNAFVQQIKSVRTALERTATQLRSVEHPIVLIGPPEVGKTTVSCTLAGLRREDDELNLNEQMALQTGGGKVTISEVHIKNGSDYSIFVDSCSVEEVHQFVSEFCDDLIRRLNKDKNQTQEGGGIAAEVERAIRNMSKLTFVKPKMPNGQNQREDLALELAKSFPTKEDLLVQILTRMELPRRTKTSITFPRDTTISGLDWVSKIAGEINNGRHPDFSLPRRVEITSPTRILGAEDLDIQIIDTRGVDEPSAPRRDLQAHLDDDRCLVVFCSKFGDAPNLATLSVIDRALGLGLKKALLQRGLLLVLPRDRDDTSIQDGQTGQWVSSPQEGREIKLEQIRTTMLHHDGCHDLPVQFLNVQEESDNEQLRSAILEKIHEMRQNKEKEIDVIVSSIDRFIANQKTEETRAVFQDATKPLRNWFATNTTLPPIRAEAYEALLRDMAGLRYVSSLRASVNRKGSWDRFDYWIGLGSGIRSDTVTRSSTQMNKLKTLIEAALIDNEFAPAHDFLKFFLTELEKAMSDFYQWSQTLGESAFESQLKADFQYWSECQNRWGQGSGYRDDIKNWTRNWFTEEARKERQTFIETEIQKRWNELLSNLNAQISSKGIA